MNSDLWFGSHGSRLHGVLLHRPQCELSVLVYFVTRSVMFSLMLAPSQTTASLLKNKNSFKMRLFSDLLLDFLKIVVVRSKCPAAGELHCVHQQMF